MSNLFSKGKNMTKISHLYDAIIKYKKPEDQCTINVIMGVK